MATNSEQNAGTFESNLSPEDIRKLQEAHAQQAQQMETMRKQLEKIQQDAQSKAVPGSMPAMSVSEAADAAHPSDHSVRKELEALSLDWGILIQNFDRSCLQMLHFVLTLSNSIPQIILKSGSYMNLKF